MRSRTPIAALAMLAAAILLPPPSQAALLGRDLDGAPGTFESYYDDELDVTWLQDANLARSNEWAWPVRDGGVLPAPELASALMLAAGLAGFAAARRRRAGGARRSGAFVVAAALVLAGAPAGAAEKCKAKLDKKTGVVEFSASKTDAATLRWGPTSTMAVYAFFDESCVKGDGDAKNCTLDDPESLQAKIPPPSCTLWVLDANAGCSAWVEGCTPGLRELDIVGGTIGSEQISDGSVGTAELAPYAVGGSQIQNGAVGSVQLEDFSIGANDLAPGSVQNAAIAAGAVGTSHIAGGAVGPNQLAPNSVNAFHIATDGVGAGEIAADAVGSSELAAGSVGMGELDVPAGNAGNGVSSATLEGGDNYHYDNAATFTPPADGRCLVVTTASVTTVDGVNAGQAWLRTAREEDGQDAHDGLEGPYFPRIPDDSRASLTVSTIWEVSAGEPTRFGCFVFARDADFEGDTLLCRTTYFCQ